MKVIWEVGYEISARIENGTTVIVANSPGLISLARQLLILVQDVFPKGHLS